MRIILLFLILLLFNLEPSISSTNTKQNPWKFSSLTNFWLRGESNSLEKTPLVIYDSPFAVPKHTEGLLIQETFSAKTRTSEFVFRPSLGYFKETYSLYPKKTEQTKSKAEASANELYYLHQINSRWIYAFGLQNFQWGPAELLSPSNPLFHFSPNSQDPNYQIKGHSLLRINYTPGENLSFILLYEFAKNEEADFVYKTQFIPKGLLKTEYRFSSSSDYIGLSLGNEQMHDPFIGEYGNFLFEDQFSFYFDLKQTKVSKRYYPHVDYGQPPRMNLFDYKDSVYLLSLVGIRYETEYFDLRWEEISNELGFSKDDFNLISLSFLGNTTLATENMHAFLHNGRELYSKYYSYYSIRSKKILTILDSTLSLRGLLSHRDHSSLATLQWDGSVGDRVTFFLNIQGTTGKPNSEMNFLYKSKGNIGIKFIW